MFAMTRASRHEDSKRGQSQKVNWNPIAKGLLDFESNGKPGACFKTWGELATVTFQKVHSTNRVQNGLGPPWPLLACGYRACDVQLFQIELCCNLKYTWDFEYLA